PQSQLLGDLSRIDSLANHYGRLYRSSTASEFLLTILAALFSAVAFVLFPFIAGVSVIAQVLVNGLVLLDSMTRTTQRWQERWLDYGVMAGRLRCLRFLHPLGLGSPAAAAPFRRYRESWVEWYLRRCARGLDPPHGTIGAGEVARLANQLAESEIPEQLKYHRANFRQVGLLDRRLSVAPRDALSSALVVCGFFGVFALSFLGGGPALWEAAS